MQRTLSLWIILAGAVGALPPPSARAQDPEPPPEVLVLPVRHDLGGDVAALLDSIRANVRTALDAAGFLALPDPPPPDPECRPVPLAPDDPTPVGLQASGCGAQAAVALAVESSGMGYQLRLALVDAAGHPLDSAEEWCDFCTEGEMVERWSQVAARIDPPSAELLAAAAAAAQPPPADPVEPPIDLPPVFPDLPDEGPDVPWWAWAGGAAAVAAIGAGIPLLVIDGSVTCDGPDYTCPEIYDTDAAGWTLTALGVAAAAGLAVGLYFYLDDDPEIRPAESSAPDLAILPSPGGLVLAGTFGP